MSFTELHDLKRRYAGQAGALVNEFFIPVLSRAVRYDRQAGYFDSGSLVLVAAGLAAFIRNLPRSSSVPSVPMRVITGATWTREDVEAYRKGQENLVDKLGRSLLRHFEPNDEECIRLGLPKGWRPEADQIAMHRLGALAWLVAAGFLEVKIALPLDLSSGKPYQPGRGGALYHPKAGLLYDAASQVVSFQGSVNETGAAWARNREKFEVKRSWFSEQDRLDIQDEINEFETLWNNREQGLLVLPLPKEIKDYLKRFAPKNDPPEFDPMEERVQLDPIPLKDRIEAQWLLEAPAMAGGEALVLEPLWADGQAFKPYPHQARVIGKAKGAFPQSFLFCDEVGLGKTIEAGVALRWLMLTGAVRRVLLICPRSLIRQWLEELREKLALTAWWYDGRILKDVGGRIRQVENPLEEDGIVIVSRHLAARMDRRSEILKARMPWDLVIVDEAHAARRRVFGDHAPNQLLGLLHDFKAENRFKSLWLLTATPMQLDPQEVHDLLLLCGLDEGEWRDWSSHGEFSEFFLKLGSFQTDPNIRKDVIDMTRIAVAKGAPDLDPGSPPNHWHDFGWRSMVNRVRTGRGLMLALNELPGNRAEAMTPYLSRQTPLSVFMFRHTRATLRAYMERGLVRGLAARKPEDAPVRFKTHHEQMLYLKIDELCSRFYRLADLPAEERSGIGFLMAVFRKRLSSSFEAFRKSLERRKGFIETVQQEMSEVGILPLESDFIAEEDEEDEDPDISTVLDLERQRLLRLYRDPQRREELENERAYLQDYIHQIQQISGDSKFEVFQERLSRLLDEGHRVIVFTQYLDTLDFIREHLESRFNDRMGCYSGRGGEVWDTGKNRWVVVEKSEIKARARKDHTSPIRILLGTDAASEGLNLQQFSALINYDLPWNPMRVEQRIGRIDRIGQEASEVKIVNLYMADTIEEDTYYTLKNRIGAFEEVVGPLQPILAEMPQIFRKVARGEMELEEARRLLDRVAQKQPAVAAEAFEGMPLDSNQISSFNVQPPATQKQLAAWCLGHPAPGMRIQVVPEPGVERIEPDGIRACLSVNWPKAPLYLGIGPTEEVLVTFNGELADRHPPTAPTQDENGNTVVGHEGVRLLTWGDPYLTAWLEAIRGEQLSDTDYDIAGLLKQVNPLIH